MQKYFLIWLTLVAMMFWLPQTHALVIHYGTDRDPALRECDVLRYANDKGAQACYTALLSAESALLRAAVL